MSGASMPGPASKTKGGAASPAPAPPPLPVGPMGRDFASPPHAVDMATLQAAPSKMTRSTVLGMRPSRLMFGTPTWDRENGHFQPL
jgi:hypothetical protein